MQKDTVLTERGYHSTLLNDSILFSYYYYKESLILKSNLISGKTDSLRLPYKFLIAIPIGDTAIFVYARNNKFADTSLKIIDWDGNTLNVLNLKGSPFYTKENQNKQDVYLGYLNSFTLLGDKLFIAISRNTGLYPINSKELINSNVPIIAYIDLKNNTYHNLPVYNYPVVDTNADPYADMWGEPYVATTLDRQKIIISFNYTPIFYVYDAKKQILKEHYVKSFLIDTLNPTIYSFFPRYLNFLTTKHTDFYFRRVEYTAKKDGLIIMDKKFDRIGEVVLPDNFLPSQIIDNKLIGTDKKTQNVVIYKITFQKTDTSKFIRQNQNLKNLIFKLMSFCPVSNGKINIPDSTFVNYVSNFYDDTNYSVIIIPLMASCGACVKEVLYLYKFNKKAFNTLNIKILLNGPNYEFIKNYVESLVPVDISKFAIDTVYYPYYLGSLNNITFVKIQGRQLTFKRNYPSYAIDSLYDDIIKLYYSKY